MLVAKERAASTGADKTSVVCFIEKDRPGSLLAILHEFSDRQINLTTGAGGRFNPDPKDPNRKPLVPWQLFERRQGSPHA